MLKKRCSFLIMLFVLFSIVTGHSKTDSNESIDLSKLSSKSAILMCSDNNQTLYAKNENERLAIASTTKIMTALLAFEQIECCNREIEITDEMVKVEGSSMGLLPGNIITLENVAKGMMMCSGNDAANAIAIATSGSIEEFAGLMNERAKQIGMKNTNFVTPSGLDSDEHYSTAKDMAILGSYAMENKNFYEAVSNTNTKIPFIKPAEIHNYKNHNKLLSCYDGCVGIKTGFTKKAGRCLVSCAEKNGVRLVAVTLNDGDDWKDHQKMFDYGFSEISSVNFDDSSVKIPLNVVGGTKDETFIIGSTSTKTAIKSDELQRVERNIELPHFENAPIHKGQVIGKVLYTLDGEVVATNNLTAESDIDYLNKKISLFSKISNLFK